MSDHWIGIIPTNPHFVPSEEAIRRAEEYMAEIAPEAEEIAGEVLSNIQFRDCGENMESVHCPVCGSGIPVEWWADQVEQAYGEDDGFVLAPLTLPCGDTVTSLNALRYDFDQGFSRFILDGMNPNIGTLTGEQITRFVEILGCRVKVIYQHI